MSKLTRTPTTAPTPSGLIRFWLRRQNERHRLDIPGFARTIGVTPAAVHNWLNSDSRGISEAYWSGIAAFFEYPTPEDLLLAARALHDDTPVRSGG